MNRQCREEIEAAQAALAELEREQFSDEEFRTHMEEIRRTLRAAQSDAARGMITPEFVEKYIDKIFVTPEDERTAHLEIRIFTGEKCSRALRKLDVRTGHTFKKMVEKYENEIKNSK